MRKYLPYHFLPLLVACILWMPGLVSGQKITPVTIQGKTTFNAGEEVRLISYSDLVTLMPVTVASDKIGKDGSFKLSFKTNKILPVQLEVRTSRADFYVVPGWSYRFQVTMDPQLFQLFDPGEYGGFLQVRTDINDTLDLNYKINRFSAFLDRALSIYGHEILYYHDYSRFDTLMNLVRSNFEVTYDPSNFYLSHIYYTVGSLEWLMLPKNTDSLYRRYFDNEYILYDNPAYMTLFRDFYTNYLYQSRYVSKAALNRYINEEPDYNSLFNELGKDRFLINERLRELVLIMNLGIFYDHEEFDRNHVFSLLEYISRNTHFPEHKTIAENTMHKILRYKPGNSMPKLTLQDEKGSSFKLDGLKGKWVYLHFFNTKCTECIRDMLIIKELQEKYKDDITFVSVSVDLEFSQFRSFIREYEKNFDWPIVHFNESYDWLRDMGIVSLPDNILIDPSGNISQRFAPDPSRNLSRFLLQKFHKEEENSNPLFHNRSGN